MHGQQYVQDVYCKFMNLIRCKPDSDKNEKHKVHHPGRRIAVKLSLNEISTDKLKIGWWEGCGEGGGTLLRPDP
jgi:hypothetical protein